MLLHGFDPFKDGLTEFLYTFLLGRHGARLPAIVRFEVPVCDCALALLLRLPDHLHRHAKLSIPDIEPLEFTSETAAYSDL
jgi:hypothetical protein